MKKTQIIKVIITTFLSVLCLAFFFAFYYIFRTKSKKSRDDSLEAPTAVSPSKDGESNPEELLKFSGGETLTANDILEAPGEVVGKSSYGTLYRACIHGSNSVVLLRFVRPACAGSRDEILSVVRILGGVRHPNLVELRAMYAGPRGEKLFVHPFFAAGNLKQFLRAGVAEAYRWDIIYKLSCGIAKGVDHLHTGLLKPIIHGNLKSNNVLLGTDYQPLLSDYGLHLILNSTAAQEMLRTSAAEGYKAPELNKAKDASMETDIYSLGVVLLEMLTQKDPVNNGFIPSKDSHQLRNNSDRFKDEGLTALFRLAMACCSPSPTSRPDIKRVIRRLEEIGR